MLKKREREKLIYEINVTPLTDVMLVLLIIFMVTTPFIVQGSIKINLPSASASSDDLEDKDTIIGITAEGRMYVNGKEAVGDAALINMLKTEIGKSRGKKVIIEGDKQAAHGVIVKVMGVARTAGAQKLAVSTIPEMGGQKGKNAH